MFASINEPLSRFLIKNADAIAARNDLSSLNPEDCLRIIWAYATAKVSHPYCISR